MSHINHFKNKKPRLLYRGVFLLNYCYEEKSKRIFVRINKVLKNRKLIGGRVSFLVFHWIWK
jgi:hypothetical protein